MLALSIHQNQDIQGITCGNIHKKISMLADDAILAIKNQQTSFMALLHTLEHFALISNLVVNKEKSCIVSIGSHIQGRSKLQGMDQFTYQEGGYIHYLGAFVPTSTQQYSTVEVSHKNYENLTGYIHQVLSPRDDLTHPFLGRVLNVKAFVGSKLLYLFSMTPSPTDRFLKQVQLILNNYVWSHRRHNLPAALMYQPWDTRGVLMYSCVNQNTSLKLKWLNRLLVEKPVFGKNKYEAIFYCLLKKLCVSTVDMGYSKN